MKKLIVSRKKIFAGSLLPYWIIVGFSKAIFMQKKEKMDLDIQVSKLKLMKGNHTSRKYKLEDNIAKHYPQQIAILKERISGMTADIQTAKTNLPAGKEQFIMKVGDKVYTDKKEAGTALVEMCKEMKTVNVPATVGEYAGFKMAVSFDSFNYKFVMNLKGQLSHNLEVGSDPLGNIARINHALESMPKRRQNWKQWSASLKPQKWRSQSHLHRKRSLRRSWKGGNAITI